ncbi:hypothetical protein ROA7450_02457 [Roseovarius albus]|uniref:Uncharacterized protein n=1 Tax=Roseovarius albus TaxID=1247867 RepID=A0A1X6ZFP5_9RHOB|nr:hypothetical protein ROA7450_02457 [Roseovarius albus]
MIPFLTEILELITAASVLALAAPQIKKIEVGRNVRCVSLNSFNEYDSSTHFVRSHVRARK